MVVSRKPQELDLPHATEGSQEPVMGVGSIEEGLKRLESTYPMSESQSERQRQDGEHLGEWNGDQAFKLGRVFIIGGGEIYGLALRMPSCKRILWTRLRGEWECDTFFPLDVEQVDRDAEDAGGEGQRWVRKDTEEMERWAGEEGFGGLKKEGEVEFEVRMLEKEGLGG